MPSFVITGVSTGIGHACTADLLARGFRVFGSVRKQEDADRLQAEFGDQFVPLVFDVTDQAAVKAAADQVRDALHGELLAGLVNNAGIAVPGPLMHLDVDQLRQQLEVNVVSLLGVSQAFLPLLGASKDADGKPGRIVNIGSTAGKRAVPFLGAYAMSKFAVEAFTDTLRREMMLYGIDVITVGPGPIKTKIWDKAEQVDTEPYRNTDFFDILVKMQDMMVKRGHAGLEAEKVAEVVHHALTSPSAKPRYAVVPSFLQDVLLPALLPVRVFDRLLAKALGIKRL